MKICKYIMIYITIRLNDIGKWFILNNKKLAWLKYGLILLEKYIEETNSWMMITIKFIFFLKSLLNKTYIS